MNPEQIFAEAKKAGTEAFANYPENAWCGFAWVNIRPARGAFVTYLKKNKIGRSGTYGGWDISSYDCAENSSMTQCMDRKAAGCQAFANVLRENGIDAYVQTRDD